MKLSLLLQSQSLRALWPARPQWRRYRVTPRANSAVFRRQLLRAIHNELRRIGERPGRVELP